MRTPAAPKLRRLSQRRAQHLAPRTRGSLNLHPVCLELPTTLSESFHKAFYKASFFSRQAETKKQQALYIPCSACGLRCLIRLLAAAVLDIETAQTLSYAWAEEILDETAGGTSAQIRVVPHHRASKKSTSFSSEPRPNTRSPEALIQPKWPFGRGCLGGWPA